MGHVEIIHVRAEGVGHWQIYKNWRPGEPPQCALDEQRYPHAGLDEASFDGCSPPQVDLCNAWLKGATFRDKNLTGARIAGANLFAVTFERCKPKGIDIHDGLTLTAAIFTGCIIDYSNFLGVELDKMSFHEGGFREANLSLASLRLATFIDCDLTRVDLTETTFFQIDRSARCEP